MPHRPDPTDLAPLKFALFGTTRDGYDFTTGIWTRDFSVGSPPDLTAATAFVNAIKTLAINNTLFTGFGWRPKASPIFVSTAFATPIPGSHGGSGAIQSNSATLGYGGVAVDVTGATRNIRTVSHVPVGFVDGSSAGQTLLTRADSNVAAFLDYLATVHPTDNFGRPLHLYSVMTLQNNAHYQGRGGF